MKLTGRAICRILLSVLFFAFGVLNIMLPIRALPAVTFAGVFSGVLGLLMAIAGVLGVFHLFPAVCRVLAVELFALAALLFVITLIMHLFAAETAVSFGSLGTAFLAALYLSSL